MEDSLFKLMQDWMKVENVGVELLRKPFSENEKRAIDFLESITKIVEVHHQAGLFWKQGGILPNNRWLAFKQLDQLDQKLSKKSTTKRKVPGYSWRKLGKIMNC